MVAERAAAAISGPSLDIESQGWLQDWRNHGPVVLCESTSCNLTLEQEHHARLVGEQHSQSRSSIRVAGQKKICGRAWA